MLRDRIRGPLAAAAAVVAAAVVGGAQSPSPAPEWLDAYREPASRLVGAALADTAAWTRVAELTDTFGHRLAGSKGLEDAITWALAEMRQDGLENVRGEKVLVPHWVRGRETAELVAPARHSLVMLGLGNSVGTPPAGIEAEAVVVRSFDELDARGAALKGKIVVYNVPWTGYGETVRYRSAGASRACARPILAPCRMRRTSRRSRRPRSPTRTQTGCSGSRTAGRHSSCA